MPDIGELPPRVEPAPLATFQRPPPQPDKYATIRTGGKYDKSHKYAQQVEREEAAATLDRRTRRPQPKTGNGVSIVHQPLPEPPQPLSAAHFTQYRSPAPPALPCCPQGGPRSQARAGRTPEKFFSTSSQQQQPGRVPGGGARPSHSHTLDRRHHAGPGGGGGGGGGRSGSQTLDRRGRGGPRGPPQQQQEQEGNKDLYAVTEL